MELTENASQFMMVQEGGVLTVYDIWDGFQPIKQILLTCEASASHFAMNASKTVLVVWNGKERQSLTLYSTDTFQIRQKLSTNATNCIQMKFSKEEDALWMLDAKACEMVVFDLSSDKITSHGPNEHLRDCTCFSLDVFHKSFLTGDSKGRVSLWSISCLNSNSSIQLIQRFCGHSSSIRGKHIQILSN